MDDVRQEFLKAVFSDKSYDFIANHYSEMTKEELKDVVLELLYAVHTTAHTGNEQMILADMSLELNERWSY